MQHSAPRDAFRVIALIAAYNEEDIISSAIGHLVDSGVDVYLIDNRSTDNTVSEARKWLGKGLLEIEEFPEKAPEGEPLPFDWTAILRRKEELAATLDAAWFLHHDADEFREAPWPGMKLADAIRWVDRLGYNCIDFRVFNFPPTDDAFRPGDDPRSHFRYWNEAADFDRSQLKCWKKGSGPVSLIPSGGHEVGMSNRRVFPIPFLLRHYPIRGQTHGRRKIFSERRGRFLDRERAREWHIQYDGIEEESHDFLADPAKLRPFDENQMRLELMLDNAVTRHEKYLAGLAKDDVERAQQQTAVLSARSEDLARATERLEKERAALEMELARVRQQATHLENLAEERSRSTAELKQSVDALKVRTAELERALGREEGRASELERRARELETARKSSWRAALRRLFGMRGDRRA